MVEREQNILESGAPVSNTEQSNPQSETRLTFGQVMREFRKRERLSQKRLGALLETDGVTIARLEAGTRKPPRKVEFYELLRNVPGVTDEDISHLLQTENAPRWVYRHSPQEANLVTPEPVSVGGITAKVVLEIDNSIISRDENERIEGLVKKVIELDLTSYLKLKADLRKLVEQSLPPSG